MFVCLIASVCLRVRDHKLTGGGGIRTQSCELAFRARLMASNTSGKYEGFHLKVSNPERGSYMGVPHIR